MSRPASFRTPLARARGLGSARSGLHHWWIQRITALALVPLGLWLVVSIVSLAGAGHEAVVAWIGHPVTTVLLILTVASTFHHAQLGMQVIYEDYIAGRGLRLAVDLATKAAALVLGLAATVAILRIAFSA